MNVLLSGSSGLIGSELKKNLENDGHKVTPLSRDFDNPINFEGIDAIIHLAGENIAQGRWTKAKKSEIRNSRVNGTKKLSDQLATSPYKPSIFISSSATGFYGDRSDNILDEESSQGAGFLPEVCVLWEKATKSAEQAEIRTVHIRTGVVLTKKGGALKKMLPPFLLGGGGILGNGKQYMSWISLEDEINAILFILNNPEINGAVNLTAPNPVDNKEFTKILGKTIKKPTILPLPGFAARLLFGEMAEAILLTGNRVLPNKLLNTGFTFSHPTLDKALENILK
mgnify:FL=1